MIIPAGYRVLVRADAIETESDGGIILIQDEKLERAAQTNGTLVRIGGSAWDGEKPWAEVGDRVTYIRHSGKPIIDPETNEEFVIINDQDILSIIVEG